jgi:predicted DNA-binding protein
MRRHMNLVTVWLPTELSIMLEVYAKLNKTTKSDVVREALKEYFSLRGFTAIDAYLLGKERVREVVVA